MAKKKTDKQLAGSLTRAVNKHKVDNNKKKLLKALLDTRGLVLTACNKAGLSRSVHYQWMNKDKEYKANVDAINDMMVEGVESRLKDLIDEGNTAAIIFYLKTKGRDVGYGTQIKVEAEVKGELKINAIFNDDLIKDVED